MRGHTWSIAPQAGVEMQDVLAVLDDEDTALPVARAAVREARTRSARVHFLRLDIAPPTSPADTHPNAGQAMAFQAALRALRDETRVPVTFETWTATGGRDGRAPDDLVRLCEGAAVLVVGRTSGPDVDDLRRRARCDVLLVGNPATVADV